MGIANSADGQGQYLFSGYQGSTKPFGGTVDHLIAGTEITYAGDDGQRRMQVSATRQMEVSDSGSDVFMRIKRQRLFCDGLRNGEYRHGRHQYG